MKALAEQIGDIDGVNIYGRVVGVRGLMVEIAGPIHAMSVGARIVIETGDERFIPCEVVGFSGSNAVVMPFAGLEGVRRGCRAVIANAASQVRPQAAWLGRVLNAMGEPIDGKGQLAQGASPMPFRNIPPPAQGRSSARPRRPRAQHIPDLLPRSAARHLRRIWRRQIGALVDACPQRGC
jgi:flagellum-specific ATP synthase